jgi:hypothetical protein
MKIHLPVLLLIPILLLILSCASSPETATDDAGSSADVSSAGEEAPQSGTETVAGADIGLSSAAEQPDHAAGDGGNEIESTAPAEPAAEEARPAESESLPPPEPILSPAAPRVGEEISVELDRSPYETVTFDFGDGAKEEATYTYTTFGLKSVIVAAVLGDQSTSSEVFFPVTGTAKVNLTTNTVEHDAEWLPLIDAVAEVDGDFDAIVVYENRREILRANRPDEYKIPVPFTGERTFTAALFEGEQKVADVPAVTIIGLNSPPGKPVFDGQEFISSRPGEEVSFAVTAVDQNKDPLIYEVKFAPNGAVFDEVAGIFTWTPTSAQRGVYLLHFVAYDQPYGLVSQFAQRGIMVQ